jgi:hypothetical protein
VLPELEMISDTVSDAVYRASPYLSRAVTPLPKSDGSQTQGEAASIGEARREIACICLQLLRPIFIIIIIIYLF